MAQLGKKKGKGKLLATALLCSGLFAIAADYRLHTRYYTLFSHHIKESVRLLLLTDLHSCRYGKGQKNLLGMIDSIAPDVILLGGDIFDDKLPYTKAIELLQGIGKRYPCFFVSGNHEYRTGDIDNIKALVADCGVQVLSGDCVGLSIGQMRLNILGVDDPSGIGKIDMLAQLDNVHAKALENEADFTMLLAHRPELIDYYVPYEFDLVLSGHTHGGQWRLPGLIEGLFAPHQGLFPALPGGLFPIDKTALVISRGLARESTLVPRFFNPPELVVVDLEPDDEVDDDEMDARMDYDDYDEDFLDDEDDEDFLDDEDDDDDIPADEDLADEAETEQPPAPVV